jgi:hypothetical protein
MRIRILVSFPTDQPKLLVYRLPQEGGRYIKLVLATGIGE